RHRKTRRLSFAQTDPDFPRRSDRDTRLLSPADDTHRFPQESCHRRTPCLRARDLMRIRETARNSLTHRTARRRHVYPPIHRSIMTDVRWLIDGWADKHVGGAPFYASDYFEKFYEYALQLIRNGKAYVCDMT